MWNKAELVKLIRICQKAQNPTKITEVYGASPLLDSGRPREDLMNVGLDEVSDYFRFCRSLGITTNYLFNAVYGSVDQELLDKIQRLVDSTRPDKVTISSYQLMEHFSELFPEIPIYVSTITGIKAPSDLQKVKELREKGMNIEGVSLHHDSTLDRNISLMVGAAEEQDLGLSILVNENCEAECPIRRKHYEIWTASQRSDSYDPCLNACITHILEEPWKLLGLAGMIRPEDIDFYNELGIHTFKIAGRNKSSDWLELVVRAYAKRDYQGNLIDLLVFTIPLGKKANELFYVDNPQVRPLRERRQKQPVQDMKEEAERLFSQGSLRINDEGSVYKVVNGVLQNLRPGRYLQSLQRGS